MKNDERYQKGLVNLEKVDQEGGKSVIDSLAGLSEDVGATLLNLHLVTYTIVVSWI